MSQSQICDALDKARQVLEQGATILKQVEDLVCQGNGGNGNTTACKLPNQPDNQALVKAKSATEFVCAWFTQWQGYDPINVKIDPSLQAQGIGGYNDPDNRVLALNSDDPNYKVLGIIENWKIMAIEGLELVTRHTENDWDPKNRSNFGDATGHTYLVSELGHRKQFYNPAALSQAGA